jgi:hypothetical protein
MANFTRKPQTVSAIRMEYGGSFTDLSTVPATTITFSAGDWLIRRANGKQEVLRENRFKELYAPAVGDASAEAMYNGQIDPTAP